MARRLVVLLVLLVGGTLGVFWRTHSSELPAVTPSGSNGAQLDPGSVQRLESPSQLPRGEAEEQPAATRAPGMAVLAVTLIGKTDHVPLAGMRVRVTASRRADRDQAVLPPSAVTDERGSHSFDVPPNFELELSSWSDLGELIHAHADVPMLSPGEQRDLTLEVNCKETLHFHGRVLAIESSRPIAGAAVEVTQTQSTYWDNREGPRIPGLRRVLVSSATTDADGLFELRLRPEMSFDLWVKAAGRSLTLIQVAPGHETPAQAREVRLKRSATLRARITDAEGRPSPDSTVRVCTESWLLRGAQDERMLTPPTAVNTDWKAAADPGGVCVLTDLPAGVALKVELRVRAQLVREDLAPIRLEPGEDRVVEWRVGSGCTLAGVLLDQDGRPLADRTIWLLRAESESMKALQLQDEKHVVLRKWTDADGRFQFEDLGAGSWLLGPAPAPDWAVSPPADPIAAVAQRVEISEGTKTQQVTVIATRALYIRGSVLDASSNPIARIHVYGNAESRGGGFTSMSDDAGVFVLGPLPPGRYRVTTIGMWAADAEPVETDAGQSGVVLRLKSACTLTGTVIDSSTGKGCSASISWESVEHVQERAGGVTSEADGSFSCTGLAPGAYHVFARGTAGGTAVLPEVIVRLGIEAEPLTLSLSPGSLLRFRSNSKSRFGSIEVRQGGVRVAQSVLREAKLDSVEVPSGHLVIEARWWPTDTVEVQELDIGVGEERELVFGGG